MIKTAGTVYWASGFDGWVFRDNINQVLRLSKRRFDNHQCVSFNGGPFKAIDFVRAYVVFNPKLNLIVSPHLDKDGKPCWCGDPVFMKLKLTDPDIRICSE